MPKHISQSKSVKNQTSPIANKAAITIQSHFRGFWTRKKYSIQQLAFSGLTDYSLLIKGNDPEIIGLPQHSAEEKIALIGTSGLRSLLLACQLSAGTPKLVIIDNSKKVIDFWRAVRAIIKSPHIKDLDGFFDSVLAYVMVTGCTRSALFADQIIAEIQGKLLQFGFNKIKKIVSNVTVIGQSWSDKKTIVNLKNSLNLLGFNSIYAYPSNIVRYLEDARYTSLALDTLENIEILNPKLAIHTDLIQGKSTNVYLVDNHDPLSVYCLLHAKDENLDNSPGCG